MHCIILSIDDEIMSVLSTSSPGRILGDVNLNLDDKSAIKARGIWEDWHLRQLIDHPSRTNHVSGNF